MALVSPAPRSPRPRWHRLTVSEVERLTAGAVAISFAVPEELAGTFAFAPGQHLTVRATLDGEDVRRSYSICLSRPEALRRKEVRIGSALVPGGAMSTWLAEQVTVGDQIEVLPPLGDFTCPVQPEQARRHVFVAAGSGITPVLSLLATVLEEEPLSQVRLLLGNRRADTIMFAAELAALQAARPDRFELVHVLSREPDAAGHDLALVPDPAGQVLSGRLDRPRLEALLGADLSGDAVDEWYLCGPSGVVENARELLADNEIDSEHVHYEVFHVEGVAPLAER